MYIMLNNKKAKDEGKRTTPFVQACPFLLKGLNAIVIAVGNIQGSIMAQGNVGGLIELTQAAAWRVAGLSDDPYRFGL